MFLIVISSVVFFNFTVKADYAPMTLAQMAMMADTIFSATIEKVNKDYFWISDNAGSNRSAHIKVRKFRNWACASRWDSYMVGQRVVLFLKREKGFYRIMSGGGEGELPVFGDSLMINAFCLPLRLMAGESGTTTAWLNTFRRPVGKSYYSHKLFYGVTDFLPAVVRLRNIFKWKQADVNDENRLQDKEAKKLFNLLRYQYLQSSQEFSYRPENEMSFRFGPSTTTRNTDGYPTHI